MTLLKGKIKGLKRRVRMINKMIKERLTRAKKSC